MIYLVRFVGSAARLYAVAQRTEIETTVTSTDCGPPCDVLRQELLKAAEDLASDSEQLEFEFGDDLSNVCWSVACDVESSGLFVKMDLK